MRAFSAALVCVAVLVLSLVVWCDAPRHESDLAIAHGGLHEVELRTNRSRAEVIPMRVGSNARQHEVEAGRSADVRVGRLIVNAADSIDFDRAQVFFWPKASGSKLSAGEIIKSDVDSRGEFPIPQQVAESYQRYVAAAIGSGLVTSEPVAVSKIDPLELPAMRLLAKRLVFHDRNGGELRLSKNLKRQGSYAYPSRAVFFPPWEEVHIPRIVLEGAGIPRPGLMGERATWLLLGARPLGDESAESGCQFYANFPGYHPDSVGVSLEPMSNVVGEQRVGLSPTGRGFTKIRVDPDRVLDKAEMDLLASANGELITVQFRSVENALDSFSIAYATLESMRTRSELVPNGRYHLTVSGVGGLLKREVPGDGVSQEWVFAEEEDERVSVPASELWAVKLVHSVQRDESILAPLFVRVSSADRSVRSSAFRLVPPYLIDGLEEGSWILEISKTEAGLDSAVSSYDAELVVPGGAGGLIELDCLRE